MVGTLDFRGVTRPLTLEVARWKCQPHPLNKRDWCGADAQATFSRADWGFDVGKDWGFSMATTLLFRCAVSDDECRAALGVYTPTLSKVRVGWGDPAVRPPQFNTATKATDRKSVV